MNVVECQVTVISDDVCIVCMYVLYDRMYVMCMYCMYVSVCLLK